MNNASDRCELDGVGPGGVPPRLIPCLLLHGDALVKTRRFADPIHVGDPVNVLNIFSAFEADEIVLLDIRATQERRGPRFDLLAQLASECFVPLTYGGGLTSLDDARHVLATGFEKIVINTALDTAPNLVSEASKLFGRQAVVASIDSSMVGTGQYDVVVEGGTRSIGVAPAQYARRAEELGAGEILLTSVDRDGTMQGYDLDLIRSVTATVGVPVIACGGAGNSAHLADPIKLAGASAVAAGSIWVFQGTNRAVLINFPRRGRRAAIFA